MATVSYSQYEVRPTLDKEQTIQILEALKNKSALNAKASTSFKKNEVFIKQLGYGNNLNLISSSNTSDINLTQNGKGNDIQMFIQADKILSNVNQLGTNNYHFEFSRAPEMSIESNILQQGINNSLTIYERNSLSEKIKVNMKGNDQTVIIRNFK
jgi:hypothetical protein